MEDVQLSLEALRVCVSGLDRCAPTESERKLGHLLALARLLRSDPILGCAIRDLERDPLSADARRVQEIEKSLAEIVDDGLRYLAKLYHQTPNDPWKRIVRANPKRMGRATTQETLPDLLERVHYLGGGEAHAPGLTRKDIEEFTEVAKGLLRAVEDDSESADLRAKGVAAKLVDIVAACEATLKLKGFRTLCTGSVVRTAERFDELLCTWESRLKEGPGGGPWALPPTDGLEHDAGTVASRIELHLNGRRSQRFVLRRAKVYFEHFFYREARKVIEAEEKRVKDAEAAGKKAVAQREISLRRDLDRYIFEQGFFPITEASAKRGRADLILEVARTGIRPMVVEIKQAVRVDPDDVKPGEVRKAIQDARTEIPNYVGHLRGNRGWESVEPLIVVFHTSIKDVSSLEEDGVVLIDIGTCSPSAIRAREELNEE